MVTLRLYLQLNNMMAQLGLQVELWVQLEDIYLVLEHKQQELVLVDKILVPQQEQPKNMMALLGQQVELWVQLEIKWVVMVFKLQL